MNQKDSSNEQLFFNDHYRSFEIFFAHLNYVFCSFKPLFGSFELCSPHLSFFFLDSFEQFVHDLNFNS